MAEFTKHMLISDIILRVTQGKPSDDLELEPRQVAFWIDQVLPYLVQQTLNTKLLSGFSVDPSYICIEECGIPSIKIKDCVDCQNNVFLCLKNLPMDLVRDNGVLRVATEDGQWADKVLLTELDNLRQLRFSKPSIKNIKYHRVRDTLFFHGINVDTYHLFKFNVAYVPVQSVSDLDDSDRVYVGDDILKPLADEIETIARRQLYEGISDEANNAQQDMNQQ